MAKKDLERAVLKALDMAPLTEAEVEELSAADASILFGTFKLGHAQVVRVQSHCRQEEQRMAARRSLRSSLNEGGKIRITSAGLRKLIREEIEFKSIQEHLARFKKNRRS